MEAGQQHDNLSFSVSHSDLPIRFEHKDINHLTPSDIDNYVNCFQSWSVLSGQFGSTIGISLKLLSLIIPNEKIYKLLKEQARQEQDDIPQGITGNYSWFIIDNDTDDYIGSIGLSYLPGSIPGDTQDTIYYKIALNIRPEYQNKGFTKTFAPHFLQTLKNTNNFVGCKLLVRTRTDHIAVPAIMEKLPDIKYLGTQTENINFVFFKEPISFKYYELDLSKID